MALMLSTVLIDFLDKHVGRQESLSKLNPAFFQEDGTSRLHPSFSEIANPHGLKSLTSATIQLCFEDVQRVIADTECSFKL